MLRSLDRLRIVSALQSPPWRHADLPRILSTCFTSSSSFSTQNNKSTSDQEPTTVYSAPKAAASDAAAAIRRVTQSTLRQKYERGEKITCVTAYDYPSAAHVDAAGIDLLLIGDSVSMVVHGHENTLPITMDEMLMHCRAVSRGAHRPLLIGDMPFGSYEGSAQKGVETAVRFLKEGNVDAVKLEGGSAARVATARAIVESGIAVMGHVGLVPQSISVLGGFRPQGQSSTAAAGVLEQALALQEAGCFSIVLECVPAVVAAAVTKALRVPTIGIGAGPYCSGQVLVFHDLLGMMSQPNYAKAVVPRFCKPYAHVGAHIHQALTAFKDEVTRQEFPTRQFSPYKIAPEEARALIRDLERGGKGEAAAAAKEALDWWETAAQGSGVGRDP